VPDETGRRWCELQTALNPAGERKVERFGWTFAPGDKVMQIENDYDKEVYNGDIGYVVDVDLDDGELDASFDGRSVTYGFGELDTLVPAYAVTIHKSQGSEYPAVVIPVLTQHYAMLQRNLLYTGITRGKRLLVLVGQKKAVAIAVRNVSGRRRWSKLREVDSQHGYLELLPEAPGSEHHLGRQGRSLEAGSQLQWRRWARRTPQRAGEPLNVCSITPLRLWSSGLPLSLRITFCKCALLLRLKNLSTMDRTKALAT
jgi:hypothetical protein